MNAGFFYTPFESSSSGSGMEERLWDYIDGSCNETERKTIDSLIASQAAWKEKYAELLQVNQLLQSAELEQPSLRFTKNVMEQITSAHVAPATRNYINKKVIWGIGAFFGISLVVFLVYGFSQTNFNSTGNDKLIPVDFSKVEFSRFFTNEWINAFIMINITLGLFILDSYLRQQKRHWKKSST